MSSPDSRILETAPYKVSNVVKLQPHKNFCISRWLISLP